MTSAYAKSIHRLALQIPPRPARRPSPAALNWKETSGFPKRAQDLSPHEHRSEYTTRAVLLLPYVLIPVPISLLFPSSRLEAEKELSKLARPRCGPKHRPIPLSASPSR